MKRLILKILKANGYNLQKRNHSPNTNPSSMSRGLQRLSEKLTFDVIVDVGAAKGQWTRLAMDYWPNACYELVEPLEQQRELMDRNLVQNPKVNFNLAVAGKEQGTVLFNVSEDLDGSGVYGNADNALEVNVVTLNEIVKRHSGNVLVKLDTHGYELPILEGAKDALGRIDAFIVEVYGFYVAPEAKLFHELSAHMFSLGYRLYDIVDVMRRPKDNAFWQADAFFLRKDHSVFQNNMYK